MTTIVAPRVFSLRRIVGWAAVVGTLPYLALKFAWLTGSTVGVIDTALFDDHSILVLNAVTAGMDLTAIVIALAFTYDWGQRLPAFLILAPIWVGTGFLVPILLLLPMSGLALGTAQEDPFLESWVQPMVYTGFGWQGLMLTIAFVLYARVRWPWVFQVERVRARRISVVLGDLGAVLAAVAGVESLIVGSMADQLIGVLALLAAVGAVVLMHGVRTRFWVPVAVAWVGAGALFAWGGWAVVNQVGRTALSGGGGVPVFQLAAMVGGGLIGIGSLILLSGHASATGGRTART